MPHFIIEEEEDAGFEDDLYGIRVVSGSFANNIVSFLIRALCAC